MENAKSPITQFNLSEKPHKGVRFMNAILGQLECNAIKSFDVSYVTADNNVRIMHVDNDIAPELATVLLDVIKRYRIFKENAQLRNATSELSD